MTFFGSIDFIHGAMKKSPRDQLVIGLFSMILDLHVVAIIIHLLFVFMDTLYSKKLVMMMCKSREPLRKRQEFLHRRNGK